MCVGWFNACARPNERSGLMGFKPKRSGLRGCIVCSGFGRGIGFRIDLGLKSDVTACIGCVRATSGVKDDDTACIVGSVMFCNSMSLFSPVCGCRGLMGGSEVLAVGVGVFGLLGKGGGGGKFRIREYVFGSKGVSV